MIKVSVAAVISLSMILFVVIGTIVLTAQHSAWATLGGVLIGALAVSVMWEIDS